MLKLAWNNIARRRSQSVLTIAITALTVFVFVLVLGVFLTTSQGLEKSQERLGADAVVLPSNANVDGYELLFTSKPENVYMDESMLEWVRGLEGVAQASPQFYSQTVDGGCCDFGSEMRIVGIDQESDFLLEPLLKIKEYDQLANDQIVLGGDFFGYVGQTMSVLDRPFTVVGELYRTGTGTDTTIFMNMDVAREITAQAENLDALEGQDPSNLISAIMVKLDGEKTPRAFGRSISKDQDHKALCVLATETVSSLEDQLQAMMKTLLLLWAASLVIAILALVGRFSALAKDRKKEIGLMRAMGIQKNQVFASVLGEAEIMAAIGGFVGSVAACVAMVPLGGYLLEAFKLPASVWSPATLVLCGLAGIALALILGLVSSVGSAHKCAVLEPRVAISQGEVN